MEQILYNEKETWTTTDWILQKDLNKDMMSDQNHFFAAPSGNEDTMIETARRMKGFHTSVFTDLLNEKEKWERATGKSVLDFSLGSPNIAPDHQIIETMEKACADPANYKYAVKALPAMLESIQHWYQDRYGVPLETSQIALLQGSQEALVNLPLIFCNPGDVVLVPDPYYPVYVEAPLLAEAEVRYMPLKEENDYLIDLDAISEKDRREAKLMIVCYPNNPTGATAPQWFLEKLAVFARENDILVIYDNAYSELIYDDEPGGSFLDVKGGMDCGVEINSFSKTYGMAGARLGVLLGNQQAVRAYSVLKSNMDYGVFLPVQYAGMTALKTGQPLIEATRKEYKERRDLMIELFAKAGWSLPCPPATMFIWAPIPETSESSLQFATELLKKTGILVTPGISFGSQGDRYVRLALVQSKETIMEAARRLSESRFFN